MPTTKETDPAQCGLGLRDPDDPIYDQATIVIGPAAKKLTREAALRVVAESGISAASPDDPIYKRAASTIFIRRITKPEDKS